MSVSEIVDGVVRSCAAELFSAYNVSLEPSDCLVPPAHFAFGAVLGFTGESMRGSMVLAMSADTIRRSAPLPSHSLRDWIAELTNQLLGRIKNQLLAYSVELHVAIPVVIRGSLLAHEGGREILPHRFTAADGDVFVWFDYEAIAGLELVKTPGSSASSEGAAFLF